MDISASPYISSQVNSRNQHRQVELQQQREQNLQDQKQRERVQQNNPLNLDADKQNAPAQVNASKRSANLNILNSQQTPRQNTQVKQREEALELRPLVVQEKAHPGVKSFIQVAQYDSDFHIIDTYA